MSESKEMNEYLSIDEIAKIAKPSIPTCQKYVKKYSDYFTDYKTHICINGKKTNKYKGAVDIIDFIYDISMFNMKIGPTKKEKHKDIKKLLKEKYSKIKNNIEDCDFRIGDKVFCIVYGNGVVVPIRAKLNKRHTVSVEFNDRIVGYDKYGSLGFVVNDEFSDRRLLYHGHDLTITANEKKPVRISEKWLCVYMDKKSENIVRSIIYKSESKAKEKSKTWTNDGWVIISGPTKIEGVKNETN